MANDNTQTVVIRGKTSFAKILGEPVLNYSKDGKEWKLDLQIPKTAVKEFKSYGISDRVKTKDEYLNGEPYITLKQRELRASGEPNKPIKVVDIKGADWDQDKLIGNGSDVDVKIRIVDFGPGKKKGVYPVSVRVLNLVPYAGASDFEPLDEGDEFFANLEEAEAMAAAADEEFKKDFGLDDLDDELPV